MNKKNIAIIGSGSWGIALAILLNRNGHNVKIWSYNEEEKDIINDKHICKFLPDIVIPTEIKCFSSFEDVLNDSEIVLIATPSTAIRETVNKLKSYTNPSQVFVLCSKGMEAETQKVYTEVIKEILPNNTIAALSGPSHAEEVSQFIPTAVVISSENEEVMHELQEVFMNERCFRVYTNKDMLGVEMGGSLKNIIALACGIAIGLGYGDNTLAALITRGLLEISRLGVKAGAQSQTFYGLTGLGDLFVTCSSKHSRNRQCGILIGQGLTIEEAKKKVGMVVEGISAVNGAYLLARKYDVDTPIINEMYDIINNGKTAKEATEALMTREKKQEM